MVTSPDAASKLLGEESRDALVEAAWFAVPFTLLAWAPALVFNIVFGAMPIQVVVGAIICWPVVCACAIAYAAWHRFYRDASTLVQLRGSVGISTMLGVHFALREAANAGNGWLQLLLADTHKPDPVVLFTAVAALVAVCMTLAGWRALRSKTANDRELCSGARHLWVPMLALSVPWLAAGFLHIWLRRVLLGHASWWQVFPPTQISLAIERTLSLAAVGAGLMFLWVVYRLRRRAGLFSTIGIAGVWVSTSMQAEAAFGITSVYRLFPTLMIRTLTVIAAVLICLMYNRYIRRLRRCAETAGWLC